MVDKFLRETKEQVLLPVAARFLAPIHPTVITLVSFGFGIVAAGFLAQGYTVQGLVFFLLNRVFDGLDGTVARLTNRQSDFGAYIDIVLDTVIYALIPAAIALHVNTIPGYICLITLLICFYVNAASWMYLAALLEKRNAGAAARGEITTVTMPGGLLEGTETILFFVLFIVFPAALIPLFTVMAVLTVVMALQRIRWAAQALQL